MADKDEQAEQRFAAWIFRYFVVLQEICIATQLAYSPGSHVQPWLSIFRATRMIYRVKIKGNNGLTYDRHYLTWFSWVVTVHRREAEDV